MSKKLWQTLNPGSIGFLGCLKGSSLRPREQAICLIRAIHGEEGSWDQLLKALMSKGVSTVALEKFRGFYGNSEKDQSRIAKALDWHLAKLLGVGSTIEVASVVNVHTEPPKAPEQIGIQATSREITHIDKIIAMDSDTSQWIQGHEGTRREEKLRLLLWNTDGLIHQLRLNPAQRQAIDSSLALKDTTFFETQRLENGVVTAVPAADGSSDSPEEKAPQMSGVCGKICRKYRILTKLYSDFAALPEAFHVAVLDYGGGIRWDSPAMRRWLTDNQVAIGSFYSGLKTHEGREAPKISTLYSHQSIIEPKDWSCSFFHIVSNLRLYPSDDQRHADQLKEALGLDLPLKAQQHLFQQWLSANLPKHLHKELFSTGQAAALMWMLNHHQYVSAIFKNAPESVTVERLMNLSGPQRELLCLLGVSLVAYCGFVDGSQGRLTAAVVTKLTAFLQKGTPVTGWATGFDKIRLFGLTHPELFSLPQERFDWAMEHLSVSHLEMFRGVLKDDAWPCRDWLFRHEKHLSQEHGKLLTALAIRAKYVSPQREGGLKRVESMRNGGIALCASSVLFVGIGIAAVMGFATPDIMEGLVFLCCFALAGSIIAVLLCAVAGPGHIAESRARFRVFADFPGDDDQNTSEIPALPVAKEANTAKMGGEQ